MGKRFSYRTQFTFVLAFIVVLSQFISIANVKANTINNGYEFFNQRTDYCSGALGSCDALMQYGINNCVVSAASGGSFFSNAQNGGNSSFSSELSNYNSRGTGNYVPPGYNAYLLLTNLLAYYYGVNPDSSCSNVVTLNTGISSDSSAQYSLDNIGSSFAILSLLYGTTVPAPTNSTYYYVQPTSNIPDGYVHIDSTILNTLVRTIHIDDADGLVCQGTGTGKQAGTTQIQDTYNTAMDVRAPFDVGRTPQDSTARPMLGILNTATTSKCGSVNTNNYQFLIDVQCGNISVNDTNPPSPPIISCSISSSSDSASPKVGVSVSFYINWKFSPQATKIKSTEIYSSTSPGSNIAPASLQSIAPSSVGGDNVSGYSLSSSQNPTSATSIRYTGNMTISVANSSISPETITCTPDTVTWGSSCTGCCQNPSSCSGPIPACTNSVPAVTVAKTQYGKDYATWYNYDQTTFQPNKITTATYYSSYLPYLNTYNADVGIYNADVTAYNQAVSNYNYVYTDANSTQPGIIRAAQSAIASDSIDANSTQPGIIRAAQSAIASDSTDANSTQPGIIRAAQSAINADNSSISSQTAAQNTTNASLATYESEKQTPAVIAAENNLRSRLSSIASTISNDNSDIATQNSRITAANNQIAADNSDIATQNSRITAANNQIAADNSDIATQNSIITAANNQIAADNIQLPILLNLENSAYTVMNNAYNVMNIAYNQALPTYNVWSKENFYTYPTTALMFNTQTVPDGQFEPTSGGTATAALSYFTIDTNNYNTLKTDQDTWNTALANEANNCDTSPYFNVIGGDIIAGTGLANPNGACSSNGSAYIYASNSGSDPWTGASDNLAALAPGTIYDLSTGTGGNNLTFANSTGTFPTAGSFGTANGTCNQDYYDTSSGVTSYSSLQPYSGDFDVAQVSSYSGNCTEMDTTYYCKIGSATKITDSNYSGTTANDFKVVLYVTGSAEIGSNIAIYNDLSDLTSPSDIPLLYVIASGNIYIDSNVTSIDGVYDANGTIYTCASDGSTFASDTALVGACKNPLTVTGSLVANQIKFGRVIGSITTSASLPWPVTPAETFNYGPEVWLSKVGGSMPLNPQYQDLTELSPVV